MECLSYSIEWLTFPPFLCLSLFSHIHCIQQHCDIQQCMFLWQPIKSPIGSKADSTSGCLNETTVIWTIQESIVDVLYTVLCSVIGQKEELSILCSSCVYSSFYSAPGASRNPLCVCVGVCVAHVPACLCTCVLPFAMSWIWSSYKHAS